MVFVFRSGEQKEPGKPATRLFSGAWKGGKETALEPGKKQKPVK